MRATEFITETKTAKRDRSHHGLHNPEIGGVHVMPNVDQGYELYRLGMDLAVAGKENTDWPDETGHPVGEHTVMLAYSKGENEIIDAVLKKRGATHKHQYDKPGVENKEVNKTSPVAKIKKNKYGV